MPNDPAEHRDGRGRFVSPAHSLAVKAAVRVDYEGRALLICDIGRKHEISGATVERWARQGGWTRRKPPSVDPNDLVQRILALLSEQIADMETVMKNGAPEVAMLAKLVTTLDRVIELKDRTGREKPHASKRVQELRAKIAERIVELNKD